MKRALASVVWLLATHCSSVPETSPRETVTADAGLRACPREVVRPGSAGMLVIPAGTFMMGCDYKADPRCHFDEGPVRTVTLAAFEIDRTEVVERDYAACAAAGACLAVTMPGPPRADMPILGVSWEDADAHCRFVGKRLPTEAEWEKAARGSSDCRYPWGDDEPDCARAGYLECGRKPRAVGATASASPYGVLDLAGNAREWVVDWYEGGYARPLVVSDPRGAASGTYRIVRGGAFFSGPDSLRVTKRDFAEPSLRQDYLGFRCARSL